ncbi:unnamed protein product [Paramecium primaurelia]|uniref:Uncharacterized protein n=1 Tax=Paramecium primaurelia TaxID=5886 RepID=A0A8S1Q715_PARPR|nr:unnamed protein product [Paramecium primaurelia]
MISLTQMTGFFTKQRKNNKTFKISYFFVDSYGTVYYLSNLAQLNYYIKNSNSELDVLYEFTQIISKLESSNAISKMSIQNCRISGIKTLQAYDNVPFYHRQHFELQISQKNVIKVLQVYSTIEDDIEILQEVIKQGSQKQRPNQQLQLNSDIEKKNAFIEEILKLLKKYEGEIINVNANEIQQDSKLYYTGQIVDGKPEGQGTLFYNLEGIHYKGSFKNGKKHGVGYIANSNLDQIDCEFEYDILTGI